MRGSWMLGVMVLLSARQGFAQEVQPSSGVRLATRRAVPANTVVADLGALLQGAVSVQYEHAFTPSFSLVFGPRVQFGPAPYVLGSSDRFLESQVGFGAGAELGARVYMQGYAPQGFFLALQASYVWQTSTGDWGVEKTGGSVQAGVHIGYQWIVARVFVASVGIGASLVTEGTDVRGLIFPVRLAFGAAF